MEEEAVEMETLEDETQQLEIVMHKLQEQEVSAEFKERFQQEMLKLQEQEQHVYKVMRSGSSIAVDGWPRPRNSRRPSKPQVAPRWFGSRCHARANASLRI